MNEYEKTIEDAINLDEWAKIVVERWLKRISLLRISNTAALMKSFEYHIEKDSGGNPVKIKFAFLYYGKFVDMGVGRGTKVNQRGMTNRVAKPWYSKLFAAECYTLAKKMADRYGQAAAESIKIIINEHRII